MVNSAVLAVLLFAAALLGAWPVDDEPPLTASPTSRFTAVSIPATGATSVAPFIAVCALSTPDCATSTCAWAAEICAVLADDPVLASLASDSLASALASVDFACRRDAFSSRVSTVARVSPAVTLWPTATGTPVTVPLTSKFTSCWTDGVKVPLPLTDFSIVVSLAATVRVIGAPVAAEASRMPNHQIAAAASATTSTAPIVRVSGVVRVHTRCMCVLTFRAPGRVA